MRFLMSLPVLTLAQAPDTHPPKTESSVAKQIESVQKQRDTIRKQVSVPQKPLAADTFFTASWTWAMPSPRPSAIQADCDPMADADVGALIDKAATREGVNAKLVRAVIRQESGFRPCAVSPRGAQGLMQLMPDTAERFHVSDPFDPGQNVDAGTKFLKELLAKYAGDLRLALGAYNAGPERVNEAGALPDIQETQDYVTSILNDLGTTNNDRPAPSPGKT